jgi:cyclopropane fatty-acyl-phospholipid synthase-like methyltransferase
MFWDNRYSSTEGFVFGTDPSQFVANTAHQIVAGSDVLCIGDGEGRNSVFLAQQGHRVTAFDPSGVAIDKAQGLAQSRDVVVDLHQAGVEDWDWSKPYDAVVAVFIQFAGPELRDQMFQWMMQALRPGGVLLLHGYTPKQLEFGTGGPGKLENLYTEQLLRDAFGGLDVLQLDAYEMELDEGNGHKGPSALIDLVARKPVV